MKKMTLFLHLLFLTNAALSQGTDILSAEQFCSGTSQLTFNNVYGSTDDTDVGCLGSIPNASYFFMQIDQPGDLIFTINQEDIFGFPIDVDFIVWGPFTDLNDANANISFTDCATCPNNTTNPNFYPYAPDNITDCSYDIAPTETMSILNAQQGEIYVVLITNFDGSQGFIDFQQTSGNGTTTCANLPICGGNFYDTGGTSGSYFNNENVTTTIYPYFAGGTVTVDFTAFNVAAGDILTVYNGPNATFPILGTVTGATDTFTSDTVTNPTGALTFVFTSNASGTAAGWESDITCTTPPPPPACGTVFYDSGGSGGPYANNTNQTTTFYPDTIGDAITATFTLFNTENNYDYLYIYDGPNAGSPLLATLTGNQNAALPGPFTSSHASGALTFVFVSDTSTTRAGWAANLTCAPYVPPIICGSTFYDSGGAGGNYSDNTNQTTTFYPENVGDVLTATFTAFNLESCCDELRVYDGPDATSPLLGIFTGNTIPGPFTSTHATGALTFVFESDDSVNYLGWAANLTCTSNCNVVITSIISPLGADDCTIDYAELTASNGSSNATITIFSENFNGVAIPTGWNANNATANTQWIISNTNNAGGTANEAMLDWLTGLGDTGNWILRSPAINIAGETNLQLSFRHYLNHYDSSYPYSIFIQTNLDNAGWVTQNSVINVANSIGPATVNINLSALSGNSLQIRFRMNGNPFGFHYWAIDDVVITADGPPPTSQITWSPNVGLYMDAALTTAYAGGFTDVVYAAPNGNQIYTATNQNNCTDTESVTRYKKVWNGITDDNWYIDTNWTPNGVPDEDNCVVIPDASTTYNRSPIANYIDIPIPIPPDTPALAKNLTIEDDGTLEIESDTYLEVVDWITVEPDGLLDIKDSASLIQITDVITNNNTGSLDMHRAVTLNFPIDYIYWSSPVESFNVNGISPGTNPNFIYQWQSTVVGNPNGYGEWINATGPMTVGKGYIVRGILGTTTPSTALFRGRPSNGIIEIPITRGGYIGGDYTGAGNTMATENDDNWNLIGNPYPSAISADDFLTENAGMLTGDLAPIEGTIYLWRHLSDVVGNTDPFYEDYLYNYDAGDYIAYNSTGSNPNGFQGSIAAGQAFFVLMDHNAPTPSDVVFNNTMRNRTLDNGQFYRQNTIERHRIWLDLINSNNNAISTLVGYVEGATNGIDRLFDGDDLSATNLKFYSVIDNKNMAIQGKTLPFNVEDIVPLGFNVPSNGTYTIAVNNLDGLFQTANQAIYLEDVLTNTIHDLKANPYVFTTVSGTHNERFILRYTLETLGIDDPEFNSGLNIIAYDNEIKVTSTNNPINTIEVYDVLGRAIVNYKDVNVTEFKFNLSHMSNGNYIVKATLYNGQQQVKKIVH